MTNNVVNQASKKHPQGDVITRHQHCADNPSKKDMLSFDEIHEITEKYFENLPGPPVAGVLTEYSTADNYDKFIRGWVLYWNAVLDPEVPLDPNLIKALIGSESSFDSKKDTRIKKIHVIGLMQLREETVRILGNHKGELSNYLIHLNEANLFDPSANICAGVRWLFRKKVIASSTLGRKATWDEAVIDYKGYWDEVNAGKIPRGLQNFRDFYNRLREG